MQPPPSSTQFKLSTKPRGKSPGSIVLWRNLGDKLMWLSTRRPEYVHALERLVDQLIRHVRRQGH